MKYSYTLFFLGALASALPAPQARPSPTPTPTPTPPLLTSICPGNTPNTRSQWCDHSIDTDWYDEVPNTGVTREYWLEITNTTLSPDGYERVVLTFNNTLPGPLIEANWGDTVKIHVTNRLSINGTTVHWHGLRQNYTVQQDGVPSIIQCPDAPGKTHTYTWRATQYGTTWYHSHYALQAWTGVFGPLVIHGPATANYDVDLPPIIINDWSHQTADALWPAAQRGGPPQLDNALINGKGTYQGVGKRYEIVFQKGKTYRLRFVNAAIDSLFKLSLDGHNMTVIAMDLVPVTPFQAQVLDITMGQRYDVLITASQNVSDYWFRAVPQAACSNNLNTDDIRAIVRYNPASTADPTTTAWPQEDSCEDVSASLLIPYVSHAVTDPTLQDPELSVGVSRNSATGIFNWQIGLSTMHVSWSAPSLLQIAAGNASWESAENVYLLPNANQWVYWVIETALPVPHPIHLHGHDFYILAQEAAASYDSGVVLNLANPPRRDVATLPASGYLVIAFKTDNPGAWLMHCHIGWHVAEGLALQFVERQDEIKALLNVNELQQTCNAWDAFESGTLAVEQDDSGV